MCFPDPWSSQAFDQLLDQNTTCGWMAESQDGINIGFILARGVEGEGEILTFAVNPAFQKQGVGGSLLSQLLEFLTTIDCRQIFLEVAIDNRAAIHLYTAFGFHDVGTRPNYYQRADQNHVSAKIMAYRLES
jgi:ribosomal-protein-alanine N-acetyltransferase